MTSPAPTKMTAEAYLAWERDQPTKHEFHDGEIFAMAGASPRHNALCGAVIRELGIAARGSTCRVLTSDQRVSQRRRKSYGYPDVTVICGDIQLEEGTRDVVTNPCLVAEVLSRSTEAYDRGTKWERYRRVAALDDYLLVSQREVSVERYQRQADGSWRYTVSGPGERLVLSHDLVVDVDAVYEGVFDLPGDEEEEHELEEQG